MCHPDKVPIAEHLRVVLASESNWATELQKTCGKARSFTSNYMYMCTYVVNFFTNLRFTIIVRLLKPGHLKKS